VIVDADTGEMPLGIFVVVPWQRLHERPLDRLEQLAAAHAKAAHLAIVHPLHGAGDGSIAFGQGEERDVAQPTKDIGLCEAYPRLDRSLIRHDDRGALMSAALKSSGGMVRPSGTWGAGST